MEEYFTFVSSIFPLRPLHIPILYIPTISPLPSGKLTVCYGKWVIDSWLTYWPINSMVIFHSYVKWPEGKPPFSYGFPMVFLWKPPYLLDFFKTVFGSRTKNHPQGQLHRTPPRVFNFRRAKTAPGFALQRNEPWKNSSNRLKNELQQIQQKMSWTPKKKQFSEEKKRKKVPWLFIPERQPFWRSRKQPQRPETLQGRRVAALRRDLQKIHGGAGRSPVISPHPLEMMMTWGWVKTLVPSEPQNSWDLWMFIPLKMDL